MVRVVEGQPFVVPTGKIFVLTALGQASWSGSGAPSFEIDGQDELRVNLGSLSTASSSSSVVPVAVGLTASAGSSVSVAGGANGNGRAWGYLADA